MKPLAIPVLPCRALDDIVPFYSTLGFEIALRQERPNPYAALRWRGADIHFFGLPAHDAARNSTTCLLIVEEVETLHAEFAEALRGLFGRIPSKGAPRLTRMRPKQTRFTAVDPAGNSIIFIRRDEPDPHETTKALASQLSPLGKAMRTAEVLRDFRTDEAAAKKVLEVALRKAQNADPAELAQARTMLAELDK